MLRRIAASRALCSATLAWLTVGSLRAAGAQSTGVGVKAGVGLSDFRGSSIDAWHATTGPTGGAFVVVRAHRRLGLQLEALLTEKGVFKLDTASNIEWTTRLRPLYAEIPVLARFTVIGQPGQARFLALAGFSAAFDLSCQETATPRLISGTGPLPQTYRYECARRLTFPESPEFAAVLGIAVSGTFVHLPLALDIRYVPGLFDVGESQFQRGTNFPEYHNVTLTASLGILVSDFR